MRFLIALCALAATPAFAQTPAQVVAYLDKDGDGKISLQEYLKFQVTRIPQFDVDGEEGLSLKEFEASLQGDGKKNAERSFKAFNNEDKPKALTQSEFLGYHAYVFQNYVDGDKDGFMTADEWAKVMGLS